MKVFTALFLITLVSIAIGQETTVVDSGSLYIYGNEITGPYTLNIENSILSCNNIKILTKAFSKSEEDTTVPNIIEQKHELLVIARNIETDMHDNNSSKEEIISYLMEYFILADHIITKVEKMNHGIKIWWKDDQYPEIFFITTPRLMKSPEVVLEESQKSTAWRIQYTLSKNGIVLISENGMICHIPEAKKEQAIIEISKAKNTEFDKETWDGDIITWNLAKELSSPVDITEHEEE